MSSQEVICFRFPNRVAEFSFAATAPKVGDRLKRGDDEWEVIAVSTDKGGNTVVTLGPPGDGKAKPAS